MLTGRQLPVHVSKLGTRTFWSGCRTRLRPQARGSVCPPVQVVRLYPSLIRHAFIGCQCPAWCLEGTESKRQPLLPENMWAVGMVHSDHCPGRFYDFRLEPLASGAHPPPWLPVACSIHPAEAGPVLSAGLENGSDKNAGLARWSKTGETFAFSKLPSSPTSSVQGT